MLVAWAAILACAPGCSEVEAKTLSSKQPPQTAGTASPKEQLDEQRMEEATKGLVFGPHGITVAQTRTPDPVRGEQLRKSAEKVAMTTNAAFILAGAYRDAILADPSNAKSYEGLARAFLSEGETSRAKPALETAVKLDPRFTQARYELGMVHQMGSDYAGAVAEWKELAAIDPTYRDVFARMAIASYYASDFGSAYGYLAEADKRKQNVPSQFRGLLKEAAPRP